jgi:hypothetical protein
LGLVGLAVTAVLIVYTQLRDASGTFQGDLKAGGYPAVQITSTRVATSAGRSSQGYDARVKVNDGCLLHLQMIQPSLLGHDFGLIEVNGEPLQLGGSPTYDQALAYARAHGYGKCAA